jgi:hypothetical protein
MEDKPERAVFVAWQVDAATGRVFYGATAWRLLGADAEKHMPRERCRNIALGRLQKCPAVLAMDVVFPPRLELVHVAFKLVFDSGRLMLKNRKRLPEHAWRKIDTAARRAPRPTYEDFTTWVQLAVDSRPKLLSC